MATWHLLAGEFPPQFGGVAAYTARLAAGLAEAGEAVHVWAVGPPGGADDPPGATVHRTGDRWSPAVLARAGAGLDAFPGPRRLVVQYAPNAWGYKGLNLGLCRWLAGRRRRGDDVRVMFHELWYFPQPGDRPARRVLSALQRGMARSLLRSCTRAYVTIPRWAELLRRYRVGRRRPIDWLPVPSNIPVADDPGASAEVRRRVARPGQAVVGHFGTYAGRTEELLTEAWPRVLEASGDCVGLLIGPGGEAFAAGVAARYPGLAGRMVATGALSDAEVSHHLRACDLLVQPYPGGVTSRRGSVMAGLAHGLAVATTAGEMTEPVWAESGAVLLAPEGDAEAMARSAAALLADPEGRARLGAAGSEVYRRHFSLERTVEAMTREDQRP